MASWGSIRRVVVASVTLVGGLVLAAPPASAASVQCGDVVTHSIKLKSDLRCAADLDGLIVGANNIKIDLDGHSINVGGDGSRAVGIRNEGFDNVRILNGRITNYDSGAILISEADNNLVKNMDVFGWGYGGGITVVDSTHVRLENNSAESDYRGIYLLRTDDSLLLGNTAWASNPGWGMMITDGNNNRIIGNHFRQSYDGIGLSVEGSGTSITGNFFDNTDVTAAVISGPDNVFSRNTVFSTGFDLYGGVVFDGERGVIADNLFDSNDGDGLRVQGNATVVTSNKAIGNLGWGIWAEEGVIDGGGNSASGNLLGQCHNIMCRAYREPLL